MVVPSDARDLAVPGLPRPWPVGLSGAIASALGAAVPTALVVGPESAFFFNAAYTEYLGDARPDAFGRPAAEVFEGWQSSLQWASVRAVQETGVGTCEPDALMQVRRHGPDGPVEPLRFARSYSALCADDGTVVGVSIVLLETKRSARTLRSVADLATRLSSALGVDDVAREALRHAVDSVGADHARVVLLEGSALRITRRAALDVHDESTERLPLLWARLRADHALPSVRVARTGAALWLHGRDLDAYPGLAHEPTGRPLQAVACVPLPIGGQHGALSLAGRRTGRSPGRTSPPWARSPAWWVRRSAGRSGSTSSGATPSCCSAACSRRSCRRSRD